MLNKLLESRPRSDRNSGGAATSAGVHVALILSALYVTNANPLPAVATESPTRVDYFVPRAAASSARPEARASAQPGTAIPRTPALVGLSIPTNIPPVDIKLALGSGDDFPESRSFAGASETVGGTGPIETKNTYDAREVDIPAALADGPLPDYPASLRTAGIEGNVVAEFVVNADGTAIPRSVRILSSTNDLFAESVRSAIRRMRFVPARIAGRPVSQTVQQLFVFKLSR